MTAVLFGTAALTACSDHGPSRNALLGQGRRLFVSAGCGTCHTVGVVRTHGRIGPDFDKSEPLTRAQIDLQINAGGGSMPSFRNSLTAQQKTAVTEFVYEVLHRRGRAPNY